MGSEEEMRGRPSRVLRIALVVWAFGLGGIPAVVWSEEGGDFRNTAGMGMVWIKPGKFRMGSESGDDNAKPVRTVTLGKGYWLGESEVTQGQWRDVMGSNPSQFTGDDNLPVERVSWDEATAFCSKLTERERAAGKLAPDRAYALPTEAQWEYACRAGTEGDFAGVADQVGWFADNSDGRTHPVKGKKANAWGLYDMHGNVWEWCADWYGPYDASEAADPGGPSSGSRRAQRGGCWFSGADLCRSSDRFGIVPGTRDVILGFRVALRDVPVGESSGRDPAAAGGAETPPLPASAGEKPMTQAEPAVGAGPARDSANLQNGAGMGMVWIKPGAYRMGSESGENSGLSAHDVTLTRGFWMGEAEVTQGQWREVMGNNPSSFQGDDTLPVEQVSWEEAAAFCAKLTEKERLAGKLPPDGVYVLPTEAQWEYACRAGTEGDFAGEPGETGWHLGNSAKKTHPVKGKKPNAWGLYDMHGNVWEYCADWYGPCAGLAATDPAGPAAGPGRVIRGGSWSAAVRRCRSANRWHAPECRSPFLGFRVCLVVLAAGRGDARGSDSPGAGGAVAAGEMQTPQGARPAGEGGGSAAPEAVLRRFLAVAGRADSNAGAAFLSAGCRGDFAAECRANAESGWLYNDQETKMTGNAPEPDAASAVVDADVVFESGGTFMSKKTRFHFVREGGTWRISGME